MENLKALKREKMINEVVRSEVTKGDTKRINNYCKKHYELNKGIDNLIMKMENTEDPKEAKEIQEVLISIKNFIKNNIA